MAGLLALHLCDIVIEVMRSTQVNANSNGPQLTGNRGRPKITPKPKQTKTKQVDFSNMDQVLVNAHSSHGESRLYMFEDNEAVIKMIIKGRSPTMRHVSGTHRVALDCLFDRMNSDPKIHIKDDDTQNQMADMLT